MGDSPIVRAARMPAGGSFSAPEDISDPGASSDQLDIDAAGTTTVITWRQADRTRAAIASGTGTFAMQNPLPVSGQKGDYPVVAVASSGAAVVAWRRYDTNGYTLRAAARHLHAPVGRPRHRRRLRADLRRLDLGEPARRGLRARRLGRGHGRAGGEQAVAIWTEFSVHTTIRGAERSADGVFGNSHAVSPPGEDVVSHSRRLSIEADDEGSAMAWWARDVKPSPHAWPLWQMQVRPYDTVAPSLPQITVPIRARVGQDLTMTAPARDRWTGATVTWEFGDGGTEEGEHVTYAYSEPGTYEVRITATDAAGNERTVTRSIEVLETLGPRP